MFLVVLFWYAVTTVAATVIGTFIQYVYYDAQVETVVKEMQLKYASKPADDVAALVTTVFITGFAIFSAAVYTLMFGFGVLVLEISKTLSVAH